MAEAAGPDEDDALTPGYKAPAKVGIADMMKSEGKDDEDEALQRWKAQLLAGADCKFYLSTYMSSYTFR